MTLAFITLYTSPILSYAEKPTAEEIKLEQDKVKYKAYIPAKYHLFEAIEGDLNEDGRKDVVLIVKATDKSQWVNDQYRGKLDRNRRGIIVLFNQNGQYKKVVENLSAFSSENEEGGVYYAPELWINIEKNLLHVHYGHGRYGFWDYSFRVQGNDFQMVGYDSSENHGPYIDRETSINFLTQKKLIRRNSNPDENGDPKFQETWTKINVKPIYLSQIEDFDELEMP